MSASLEKIKEQAFALTAKERAELVDILLESLHSPLADVESTWSREIEQRVAAFDRGEIAAYPAEDVFADARRIAR
jgi:putative addiction module component (TIGR02574 family)